MHRKAPGCVRRFARLNRRMCGVGQFFILQQRDLKGDNALLVGVGGGGKDSGQIVLRGCKRRNQRIAFVVARSVCARDVHSSAQTNQRAERQTRCHRRAPEPNHFRGHVRDSVSKSRSTRAISALTAAWASVPSARKCRTASFGVLLFITLTMLLTSVHGPSSDGPNSIFELKLFASCVSLTEGRACNPTSCSTRTAPFAFCVIFRGPIPA